VRRSGFLLAPVHLKENLNVFMQTLSIHMSRYLLRRRVKQVPRSGNLVRVIIGAASTEYEGWLSTDLPILDALNSSHWRSIFPYGSLYRILAEHVIEHWTEEQFRLFLRTVEPYLAEQGRIRIAVPDGFHPDSSYIEYVKPGGTGAGADDHKVIYNHVSVTRILSDENYAYRLLEYFDEKGKFHRVPWDTGDGFVSRSSAFDSRNKKSPLSYTSLIVDAWPHVAGVKK